MWQQGAEATLADTKADINENIDLFLLKCDIVSPVNPSYVDQINYYYRLNKLIATPNGPYITTTTQNGEKPLSSINFKIRQNSSHSRKKTFFNTSLNDLPNSKLTPSKISPKIRPQSNSSNETIVNEKKDPPNNNSFSKSNKIVTFSDNSRKNSTNFTSKPKLNTSIGSQKPLRNSIEREKLFFGKESSDLSGLRILPMTNQSEKAQFHLLSSRLAMDKTLKTDANKLTKSVSQKISLAALRFSANNNLPPIETKTTTKLKKIKHKSASNAELSFQEKHKISTNKEPGNSVLNGFSDDENDTLVEEAFEEDLFFGYFNRRKKNQ